MLEQRVDAEIRSLIKPLAAELAELVTRAALLEVEQSLKSTAAQRRAKAKAPARGEVAPVRRRRLPGRPVRSTEPLSFDHYERLALERALAESGGNGVDAAGLLGIGKSTMYRKMIRAGIPVSGRGEPKVRAKIEGPSGLPLSLKAYQRLCVERALRETGGSSLAAAKLLRVGKSTMYRMVGEHGLS